MLTPLESSIIAIIVVLAILWLINSQFSTPSKIKSVVNVVLALIVVGVVLWMINTYIPMAGSIRGILNIVVVVATCVFVLQALGLWGDVVRLWARFKVWASSRRANEVGPEQHEEPTGTIVHAK